MYSRIICLLLNLISSHVVLTPPNAAPGREERDKFNDTKASELLVAIGRFAKLAVKSITVLEILIAYISTGKWLPFLPSSTMEVLEAFHLRPHNTRITFLATTLVCGAAAVRWTCYRYLGRHFTFELAFQNGQKLVKTGPYSVVRHPAYTGALMYIAGSVLLLADDGSVWVQCGLWQTTAGWFFAASTKVLALLATTLFVKRTQAEDEVLRKEFKDEWVQWSQETPYRLVPYIY